MIRPACILEHPLPNDSYTDHMLRGVKFMLETLRCFRRANGKSIHAEAEEYALWEAQRGTPKTWVKWVGPIISNSTAKNRAAVIFGKDPSPISKLGDRPVSAYIRHLLFGRSWSQEQISHHLISQHGYTYTCAQPMIRRVIREEELDGKQSAYYQTKNEQSLFPEGVVNPE